jgi:hypothetical protein
MSTYVIRIDPDGSVTRCEGESLFAISNAEFTDLDIVTLRHSVLDTGDALSVGAIDDWGKTKGLPINRKAYAVGQPLPIILGWPGVIAAPCLVVDPDGTDVYEHDGTSWCGPNLQGRLAHYGPPESLVGQWALQLAVTA